jgi:hypothetical protein
MKYYQILFAIVFIGLFMGSLSQVIQPDDESFLETEESNTLSNRSQELDNDDNDVSLKINDVER